jgi:hypothetical protein
MRAAIEALPFESPKLSATAVFPAGEDFASQLERAIERSGAAPRLIEVKGVPAATRAKSKRSDHMRRSRLPTAFVAARLRLPRVVPNDVPAQSREPYAARPPLCLLIADRLRLSHGAGLGHQAYAHQPLGRQLNAATKLLFC